MRRRDFIRFIAGSAAAWPIAAYAQQPGLPVIGFLHAASPQGAVQLLSAFLKGLSEAGYVDGRNVAIEYRWADGRLDQLPAMATDLVNRRVAVITAATTPGALAAKAATATIPIVFETAANPVELGLVASLNRPGANVTGVTSLGVELGPKRLELIRELVPQAATLGFLTNPTGVTSPETWPTCRQWLERLASR